MAAIHERGVRDVARSIAAGELSAEAVAEALLERAAGKGDLNAFAYLEADVVREAARAADLRRLAGKPLGPLHGVPITLKDNINTAGMPTAAGTEALRGHRPRRDAPVAAALLAAGAVLFGKTGMHELAFGITSNNAAFGAIRNPYAVERSPGGSSGGTGAAVAARLVPAGIGTDTGGSIRIPASMCGVAGFRPSLGRWPQAGIVPIASSRDTPGPLARSVDDLAFLDGIVCGDGAPLAPPRPDALRLAVPRGYFWQDVDDETQRLCGAALDRIKQAGAQLIEVDFAAVEHVRPATGAIIALYEVVGGLQRYLRDEGIAFDYRHLVERTRSPDVAAILGSTLDPSSAIPETAYRSTVSGERAKLMSGYEAFFRQHGVDGMLFPTTPIPAPLVGEDETVAVNGVRRETFGTVIRNTEPGSIAGVPGLSLPVGLTRTGLPVGLAIDGPKGRDRDLLAVGLALEQLFVPLPPPSR